MKVAVVVGNPKAQSRTLEAATHVAEQLAGGPPAVTVDLAELGPEPLTGGERVDDAIAAISQASVVIVASPTYRATYTGLLKVFLDRFPPNALDGVVGLPVMLGAGPTHALAPELLLKPVLVEMGAICPVRGLYLPDSDFRKPGLVDPWVIQTRRALPHAVSNEQEALR